MGFKLLDLDNFLKDKKAKKVITWENFDKNMQPTPGGLYSKEIFGVTSREKESNFGYIELNRVLFHPLIYKNLKKIKGVFLECANAKGSFEYGIYDGELFKITPKTEGMTFVAKGKGVSFLLKNWKLFDFDKYITDSNMVFIEFLKNSQEKLTFINKVPVIPVLYRPYMTKNHRVEVDDITDLYAKILKVISPTPPSQAIVSDNTQGSTEDSSKPTDAEEALKMISEAEEDPTSAVENNIDVEELVQDVISKKYSGDDSSKIQNYINSLFDHFIGSLDKKTGFIRSGLVGKRLDNVARLVANCSPLLPPDAMAVPWHVLMTLFDTFVVAYVNKHDDIAKKLGLSGSNPTEISKHLYYIYKNVDLYTDHFPERREIWIKILEDLINDNEEHDVEVGSIGMRILWKRDPGWAADSFWCCKPVILKTNDYVCTVNCLLYTPIGGDSFTSRFILNPTKDNSSFTKKIKINEEDEDSIDVEVTLNNYLNEVCSSNELYYKSKKEGINAKNFK